MENIGRCDRSASFSFYAHGHPEEVCQQKLTGARRGSSGEGRSAARLRTVTQRKYVSRS